MKKLFLFLSIFAFITESFAFEENKKSEPVPFECMNTESPIYDKIIAAMKVTSQKLATASPELSNTKYGYGYGLCLDLKKNSVLALAAGEQLNYLPNTCVGFSFSVRAPEELFTLSQEIVKIQNSQIDGKNGSMIIILDDQEIKLPICLDYFSFGS